MNEGKVDHVLQLAECSLRGHAARRLRFRADKVRVCAKVSARQDVHELDAVCAHKAWVKAAHHLLEDKVCPAFGRIPIAPVLAPAKGRKGRKLVGSDAVYPAHLAVPVHEAQHALRGDRTWGTACAQASRKDSRRKVRVREKVRQSLPALAASVRKVKAKALLGMPGGEGKGSYPGLLIALGSLLRPGLHDFPGSIRGGPGKASHAKPGSLCKACGEDAVVVRACAPPGKGKVYSGEPLRLHMLLGKDPVAKARFVGDVGDHPACAHAGVEDSVLALGVTYAGSGPALLVGDKASPVAAKYGAPFLWHLRSVCQFRVHVHKGFGAPARGGNRAVVFRKLLFLACEAHEDGLARAHACAPKARDLLPSVPVRACQNVVYAHAQGAGNVEGLSFLAPESAHGSVPGASAGEVVAYGHCIVSP